MIEELPSTYLDDNYHYHCPRPISCECECSECDFTEDCRFAGNCDDQLPVFAEVGRGIKGDTYRVRLLDPDTHEITQLVGESYDETTKEWTTEWMSENINGGYLEYQYHLRPYNVPPTFTITFKYHRPSKHGFTYDRDEHGNFTGDPKQTSRSHGNHACCCDGKPTDDTYQGATDYNIGDDPENECSWVWTTPAIPYIWNTQDTDEIVGSGVGTIFARECHDINGNQIVQWPYKTTTDGNRIYEHERLVYPDNWAREHFNAPLPYDPWTSQMIFGYHGNIKVPDFYDISMIVGAPIKNITNILDGLKDQLTAGMESGDNIIDLIKNWADHFHKDIGYGDNLLAHNPSAKIPNSNNPATIENYVKAATTEVEEGNLITVDHRYGSNGQHIYRVNVDAEELEGAISDQMPDIPEIKAGPGITVVYEGDTVTIGASSSSEPIILKEGTNGDFTFKYFNGFVGRDAFNNKDIPGTGPELYLRLSKSTDKNGNTVINGGSLNIEWWNAHGLRHTDNPLSVNDDGKEGVAVSHGTALDKMTQRDGYPTSLICGFTFNSGDYAVLNNKYLRTLGCTTQWNMWPSAEGRDGTNASWPVTVEVRKASNPAKYGGCTFLVYVTMINDGINGTFSATAKQYADNRPIYGNECWCRIQAEFCETKTLTTEFV